MSLVSSRELLADAVQRGYAVGAFNVFNLESLQAVIRAAEAEQAPVLTQVWAGVFRFGYVDIETMAGMARSLAGRASVPVCLHLDHGEDPDMVEEACRAGFTSVMIDASTKPFSENVAVTRRIVEYAHRFGIPVEAELGHVGGEENGSGSDGSDLALTDPAEAARFVAETGCDSLAVAIGTSHGRYHFEPKLDIPRLEAIHRCVAVPLVLHGSSYTPDEQVAATLGRGMAKINVATELSDAWLDAAMSVAAAGRPQYPEGLLTPARDAVTERVRSKMRLFKSSAKSARG
jgi:fructose-bisphosphate aldolase, class II